jgi:hypothetical protein
MGALGCSSTEDGGEPVLDTDSSSGAGGLRVADPEAGLPDDFDHERGIGEYATPDGKRVLFVTQGADPADAPQERATSVRVVPVYDTWAVTGPGPTGAPVSYDFGKSCELRVSNLANPQVKAQRALFYFRIPSTVTCPTIVSAKLYVRTAQEVPRPLRIWSNRVLEPWAPGTTGAARCERCYVTSSNAAPFKLPKHRAYRSAYVKEPCRYHGWDVTPMVTGAAGWCQSPGTNYGVLLAGRDVLDAAPEVNFHSREAPAGFRPYLAITY